MVDIKQIQKIIKDKAEQDKINRNLYLRSLGKPASSQFGWSNPIEADGSPVSARKSPRSGSVNLKTPTNIFTGIMTRKASFGFNDIKREYNDDIEDAVRDNYLQYDRNTMTETMYNVLAKDCAGWGSAYTLTYLIGEGNDRKPMTRKYHSWNAFVKYDEYTRLPEYACIYGTVDKKDGRYTTSNNTRKDFFIQVYDKTTMQRYECQSMEGDFKPVGEEELHGFTEVPVVEWLNNENKQGNAELATALIDAYEAILADTASEGASFSNAYLLLKRMGQIDDKKKQEMKNTGVMVSNDENASAEFIIKNINPAFVELLKNWLRSAIYEAAQSYDPEALKGMKEMRKSQADSIFSELEMTCDDTKRMWKQSLEFLDRVLKSFWTVLASPSVADYDTYDVNYAFAYNKPQDIATDLKDLKEAGGAVPAWFVNSKILEMDEDRARQLAEEAQQEMTDSLPQF